MKANPFSARAFASAMGLFAGLVMTAAHAQTFSFEGYGNPQRPFPGYVGPFQLGPVKISGSGEVRETDGVLLKGGSITHSDDLRDTRYPTHRTTWEVVKGLGTIRTSANTAMGLQVRVVSANYPDICPVGTLGVVSIADNKTQRHPNGQSGDGIVTEFTGSACRTHVHGMNNKDETWTDPPRSGPPSGGMWAIVTIGAAGPNQCSNCPGPCILGVCQR
jgi:hypothetical protein